VSSLLAHTLEQQISLPVARFFVLVQTVSQFFKLPTCRGLNDSRACRGERLSGSLGAGSGLPRENLLSHLGHALLGLHRLPLPTRICAFDCNISNLRNPRSPDPDDPGALAGSAFVAQRGPELGHLSRRADMGQPADGWCPVPPSAGVSNVMRASRQTNTLRNSRKSVRTRYGRVIFTAAKKARKPATSIVLDASTRVE
jgi:hypothetical protein